MLEALDDREQALAIWAIASVAILLCFRATRPLVVEFAKAVLAVACQPMSLVALAYIALPIVLMEWIGLWTTNVLAVTILWVFGAGAAAMSASVTQPGDPTLIKKVVTGMVSWTLLVEFLANLYVFSLPLELILLPTVIFVVMLDVTAAMKPELAPARRLTNFVLVAFGVFLLTRAIVMVASDPGGFLTSEHAQKLLVPIVLAVAFIPAAYLLAVWSLYDGVFARLNMRIDDPRHAAFAKRRIMRTHGLHRMRLAGLSGNALMQITRAGTREQVEAALSRLALTSPAAEPRREPGG